MPTTFGNGFRVDVNALGARGKPGLNWLGDYDSGATYALNDAVHYLGSSFRCLQSSTGHSPAETAYWTPIAIGDRQVTVSTEQPTGTAPEGSLWFVII